MTTRAALTLVSLLLVNLPICVAQTGPDLVAAHFDFESDEVKYGSSELRFRNATIRDGSLVMDGKQDARIASTARIRTPDLSLEAFTVVMRFRADSFSKEKSGIFDAHRGAPKSLIQLERSGDGYLRLSSDIDEWTFDKQFKRLQLSAGQPHEVILAVNVVNHVAVAVVDGGRPQAMELPRATSRWYEEPINVNWSLGASGSGLITDVLAYKAFHGSFDQFTILRGNLTRSQFTRTMKNLGVK